MSHNQTVQTEFARQAAAFLESPSLNATEVTDSIALALGPAVNRTLDIACGPGILLPKLLRGSRSVVGVDLTLENLRLARASADDERASVVRGVAERLPFEPGAFDAVVLRLALHHFVEPLAVLRQARSVLCPAGRLVVLDILGPSEEGPHCLRDALERFRDPSHTSLLTADEMRATIDEAGFALRTESVWSQERSLSDWSAVINEERRMADFETILRGILRAEGDPSGLALRERDGDLWFSYEWGLFVADAA